MGRECGTCEDRCIQGFSRKTCGKDTTGKTLTEREDNIKMNIREVGWGVWTKSIWLRIVISGGGGYFQCGNKPLGYIKFGEFLE
jgi:hypothetical protein